MHGRRTLDLRIEVFVNMQKPDSYSICFNRRSQWGLPKLGINHHIGSFHFIPFANLLSSSSIFRKCSNSLMAFANLCESTYGSTCMTGIRNHKSLDWGTICITPVPTSAKHGLLVCGFADISFFLPSDRCRILTHIFKFKPQSRHHRYLRPSLKRWQQCPADGRGGDLPSGHHTCLQLQHVRILLKSTIFFCKMQFEKNENKRKRNRDFLKENKFTGTVKCLFYWNPFCHLFERLCTAWSS